MAQFRELMSDIVGHAIAQNNEALTLDISKEIRETVLKEMNYLIREQNDMTEERYRQLSAEIRGNIICHFPCKFKPRFVLTFDKLYVMIQSYLKR